MKLDELLVTLAMLDIKYAINEKYVYIYEINFYNYKFIKTILNNNKIKYKYEFINGELGIGYIIKKNFDMSLKDKFINFFKKCI